MRELEGGETVIRVNAFRSRVVLSNDQVHRLPIEVGMKVMMRNWGPRLLLKILQVVQNLETKKKATIQKSVFHERMGVTESSVDKTIRREGRLPRTSRRRGCS